MTPGERNKPFAVLLSVRQIDALLDALPSIRKVWVSGSDGALFRGIEELAEARRNAIAEFR